MKKILLLLLLINVFFLSSCKDKTTVVNNVINQNTTIEDTIKLEEFEDALSNAATLVSQHVVGIAATNDKSILKSESYGSGVVIKKENNTYYIVTNRHVVTNKGAIYDSVYIYLGTLNLYLNAEVIAYDKKVDLALLKLTTEVLLVPAKLGNIDDVKVGKYCIAVGSPYDLETYFNTVTIGHISGINRNIIEDNYYYKDIINKYIQIDAAINVGCSGGGLFNINQELIGIITWKLNPTSTNIENMGFAVGIDTLKEVFKEYI